MEWRFVDSRSISK